MHQPLNREIMEALDLKIANSIPIMIDFWNSIKKRYVRTGKGCGLCSDGALWFDLTFEEDK